MAAAGLRKAVAYEYKAAASRGACLPRLRSQGAGPVRYNFAPPAGHAGL